MRSLVKQADVVVAADGGAAPLGDANLPIHVVIGDMDSFHPDMLGGLTDVTIIHDPDQESTDVEKALTWILTSTDSRDIVLAGTRSTEIDHMLGTLSVAARFAHGCDLRAVEDNLITYFVTYRVCLDLAVGTKLSLMGLGTASGIRTEGLRWPLRGENLALGVRDGIRNEVSAPKVKISVREGCLAVFVERCRSEPFIW